MRLTRRQVLAAGAALAGTRLLGPAPARAVEIAPRDTWGADLPPVGPLELEPDVRFLIVHHTATGNDYAADAVPGILRSIYRHHTEANGWPDVAYNFFVDRFGGVWEGRTGSLDAPVMGDATGGSQGFALLATFIGDHREQPPSPEAEAAMAGLLAQLAQRYGIDPTGTTAFLSRGSNRWPAGEQVVTPTIAGHRDMSLTACPGDAGYALVTGVLPGAVAARLAPAPEPPPEPEPTPSPAPTATTAPTPAPDVPAAAPPADHGGVRPWYAAAAAALAAGVAAALAAVRRHPH